nr:phage protein [Clostridium sp. Marseille-P7770]
MDVTSYDPKKVNVAVDGAIITGYASDSMITATKNEDAVTTEVGCKGDVVYSENANESGTITITLQGTSSSLPRLRSLASSRKPISVTVSDANDSDDISITAQKCRVVKMPDVSRGKTSGNVTISIFVPNLQVR